MMRRSIGFCELFCLLTLLSSTPASADDDAEYTLRYRFHRGEIVSYSVDSRSRLFLQQQEAEQEIEHSSIADKRYTVRSVDVDGSAVLDLQIDRVRLSASVDGGETVSYDTSSGDDPPAEFQGISETVGKPHARIKVSPRGELLALDWLIDSGQTAKPTIDDAPSLDVLMVLPEEAVKVGQNWKEVFDEQVTTTGSLKKTVRIQREFTLKSVKGQQAEIALRTVVLTPLHDPALESQLINRLRQGTILFDIARGSAVSRKFDIDKLVIGFSGSDSQVHTIISHTEELAPAATASNAAAPPR
jgi:hypothetical protein